MSTLLPSLAKNEHLFSNRSLNEQSIDAYVKYLNEIGVKGSLIMGTTGEGLSLSSAERYSVTKSWMAAVKKYNPQFLTVFSVSSTSIVDVVTHARLCEGSGADAVAILPSFYYRPGDAKDLAQYVYTICRAVPNLPVFYYHYPDASGVRIPPSEWIPLIVDKVPNLSGVKFTDVDMTELAKCISLFQGKVKFFPGQEDTIATATIMGAEAFIGGLFNLPIANQLNDQIARAFAKNDIEKAKQIQLKLADLVDEVFTGPFIPNLKKRIQKEVKFTVGPARPPLNYE